VLALAASPLKFMPPWGAVLLAVLGVLYLLLGSRWPRLFDVLSMTVIGCAGGLLASPWVPLHQALVVVIGGILIGGLTAFFQRVAHGVLTAIVLGVTLAAFAALAVGAGGRVSYLMVDLTERGYSSVEVPAPNLGKDPVLAAWLTGLLLGGAVAALRFRFSQWLATSAQGAALLVVGCAYFLGRHRAGLAENYPLSLAATWLCLTAVGIAAQRVLEQARPPEDALEADARVAGAGSPSKRRPAERTETRP
jgi:hypothetical protein